MTEAGIFPISEQATNNTLNAQREGVKFLEQEKPIIQESNPMLLAFLNGRAMDNTLIEDPNSYRTGAYITHHLIGEQAKLVAQPVPVVDLTHARKYMSEITTAIKNGSNLTDEMFKRYQAVGLNDRYVLIALGANIDQPDTHSYITGMIDTYSAIRTAAEYSAEDITQAEKRRKQLGQYASLQASPYSAFLPLRSIVVFKSVAQFADNWGLTSDADRLVREELDYIDKNPLLTKILMKHVVIKSNQDKFRFMLAVGFTHHVFRNQAKELGLELPVLNTSAFDEHQARTEGIRKTGDSVGDWVLRRGAAIFPNEPHLHEGLMYLNTASLSVLEMSGPYHMLHGALEIYDTMRFGLERQHFSVSRS